VRLVPTVLDVGSGKVAHTLAGHDGGTNGLAFLSGNSLASVGEDGRARLWNVARATCLHELAVDAEGADRRVCRQQPCTCRAGALLCCLAGQRPLP
jgi:WD40 repeat protein